MPNIDLLDAKTLSLPLRELIESAPLPGLRGRPISNTTAAKVSELVSSHQLSGNLQEAALWLLAGDLERSHKISQSFENADGSYWHGIMHRREGDFWNSKYWFRRVGKHPGLSQLAEQISNCQETRQWAARYFPGLLSADTVADTLVDGCEAAVSGKSELTEQFELICWWEWQLLFRHMLG